MKNCLCSLFLESPHPTECPISNRAHAPPREGRERKLVGKRAELDGRLRELDEHLHTSAGGNFSTGRGTRRVRLVRGEGRGVSDQYRVRDAACPLSTRGRAGRAHDLVVDGEAVAEHGDVPLAEAEDRRRVVDDAVLRGEKAALESGCSFTKERSAPPTPPIPTVTPTRVPTEHSPAAKGDKGLIYLEGV